MKKLTLLGIAALTALTFAGCQNTSDREAALEDQVAQLEQQVTSLEKENQELTDASSEDASTSEVQNTSAETKSKDNLDTLAKAVEDIIKKANNTSASGTQDENQQKFFEAKSALQDVENRLEYYEDQIESEYRKGNLS